MLLEPMCPVISTRSPRSIAALKSAARPLANCELSSSTWISPDQSRSWANKHAAVVCVFARYARTTETFVWSSASQRLSDRVAGRLPHRVGVNAVATQRL